VRSCSPMAFGTERARSTPLQASLRYGPPDHRQYAQGRGRASIRDLRNRGGELVDRVTGGEHIIVPRDDEPVAELRPLPRRRLAASVVVEQFKGLPPVDVGRFRHDLDDVLDSSLRGTPRSVCSTPAP
jgi:antitoxin (DNA-binding transcriptional repressor) of toxin-antitoxin stability system